MKLHHTLFSILIASHCGPSTATEKATNARLDEVARLGRQVMPFDLDQTLHIFSKAKNGGLQQVIAKNPSNSLQIALIREHLGKIAKDFKQGNFADPAKIHGEGMPGLAALQNADPGAMTIQYRELVNGAEITYTTDTPVLISAIHQWFDAQLSDHARHATMHHPHHKMHKQRK